MQVARILVDTAETEPDAQSSSLHGATPLHLAVVGPIPASSTPHTSLVYVCVCVVSFLCPLAS